MYVEHDKNEERVEFIPSALYVIQFFVRVRMQVTSVWKNGIKKSTN